MGEDGFYLAALLSAPGLSHATIRRLLQYFPSGESIWNATDAALARHLKAEKMQALHALKRQQSHLPAQLAEVCEKKKIALVTVQDANYPSMLREIYNPPTVLFYRGTLQEEKICIAIVGARRASQYGKRVAHDLAEGLAGNSITVVSGAARGIDSAAHQGALSAGRTIAVLGCGVDVSYPPENASLLQDITERGAVISEYPPGTRPHATFFPARNRIISGLCQGTVVVEAAERSGSLITAELSLSEGRDVYAVPGSIFSNTSRGCHRLIQQGAKLVIDEHDILDEYPDFTSPLPKRGDIAIAPSHADAAVCASLSKEERVIYELLSAEMPMTVDEIIYQLHGKADVTNVAFLLLQMELAGVVEEDENHAYFRAMKGVQR